MASVCAQMLGLRQRAVRDLYADVRSRSHGTRLAIGVDMRDALVVASQVGLRVDRDAREYAERIPRSQDGHAPHVAAYLASVAVKPPVAKRAAA